MNFLYESTEPQNSSNLELTHCYGTVRFPPGRLRLAWIPGYSDGPGYLTGLINWDTQMSYSAWEILGLAHGLGSPATQL
jgi:hypothetical protein|uniref:Uncharacterized protein n=1 Tax=Picea glauca TaxID=3330 RepID=A0A117NI17_PICGL|nr:hypothetical protein ABT39_MTgene3756 [Picea glauca]QHR88284.1 hypothetical protein Q903MT_gene2297 [Picea sitchensis]